MSEDAHDAIDKMVAKMQPMGAGVMAQPAAWVNGIKIARKRGAPDLSKSTECWELDLVEDKGYRLVVNGARVPLLCSAGIEIAPIHVVLLYEGYVSLVANSEEARMVAGIGKLDERHYMDIFQRELDRESSIVL